VKRNSKNQIRHFRTAPVTGGGFDCHTLLRWVAHWHVANLVELTLKHVLNGSLCHDKGAGDIQRDGTSGFQPSTILHLRSPGGSHVDTGSYPLKREKISEEGNCQGHLCPVWHSISNYDTINRSQRGLHPASSCPLHHAYGALSEKGNGDINLRQDG
jgi:hypothetical protein